MSETLLEPTAKAKMLFTDAPDFDASAMPDWFVSVQKEAWKKFQRLPMPDRKTEAWRFADLKQLDFKDFRSGEPIGARLAEELKDRSRMTTAPAARFVFANGYLIEGTPLADELLARGVVCLPFAEAVSLHGDLVKENFMQKEMQLGSEKFAAWHAALVSSGVFVHVPKNVQINGTIEVFHWLSGDGASEFPHTLVVADANSKVTVMDCYRSANTTDKGFSCGVADLIAKDGAKLTYISAQEWNRESKFIQLSSTSAGRNADVKSCLINLGSSWGRTESVSHLEGEGANSDMLSICVPEGNQQMDQRTLQLHKMPHTTSDLLYKNALYDQSRTIFAGLIMVDKGAHHTDAYQKCRNLLLSDDAEANSMPGLEINADQVKCSHGSTAGPITEEELFYLRARGITDKLARQLVTFGFTHEVIERLKDDELEQALTRRLEKKFAGLV